MSNTKIHIEKVHAFAKEQYEKVVSLIEAHEKVLARDITDPNSQFAVETRQNYNRLLVEQEELFWVVHSLNNSR
jgi:hypothetical protein